MSIPKIGEKVFVCITKKITKIETMQFEKYCPILKFILKEDMLKKVENSKMMIGFVHVLLGEVMNSLCANNHLQNWV